MPHPIWLSVIILAYACLTITIAVIAIIIRVFRLRPKSDKMVANAHVLINLKKIFGWTAIGMFLFQFIYDAVLIDAESKLDPDVFNLMAGVFFLILISAFYMLALWFLSKALARNLKGEVGSEKALVAESSDL
ncbi:MAG: hypothetical protein ACYCXF_07265 [Thermoleophilia bacterium]